MSTPSSREAPLICANTHFSYVCSQWGWIHGCGYLRFLLQTGEAVHQKFMPISLHWAQLPSKIDLKHVPNTGNSRIGNQYANDNKFRPTFFNGGVQS